VVYPPTGSTAYERDSTPPTLLLEYGPPLPLPLCHFQLPWQDSWGYYHRNVRCSVWGRHLSLRKNFS